MEFQPTPCPNPAQNKSNGPGELGLIKPRQTRFPLYARVLTGVALGILFGVIFDARPIVFGLKNEDLGQLGTLVIRLLKALAAPLVLFAILDAFLSANI